MGTDVVIVCTVVTVLIGVLTLIKMVKDSAKKTADDNAAKGAADAKANYDKGKEDGIRETHAICDPQLALAISQRDDAWHDRDVSAAQAVEAYRRVNELIDQRKDKG